MTNRLEDLLRFWFDSAEPNHMASHKQAWWMKDAAFDQRITEDFSPLFHLAEKGELEDWKKTALGCVGLVLLLDQFPRNMFRGQARAFACDPQARALTRYVLSRGFDQSLPIGPRLFLYLPLEHSEDLGDQDRSVELIRALNDADYLDYAEQHRKIIAKFGRFPHRNEALGRPSTAEEIDFLKQPGSSF